jgi:DNA adenine methylase
MKLISLDPDDFQKLLRGEIVTQGDLQVALHGIGHAQMFNALVDALTETLRLSVSDGQVPIAAFTLADDEEEVRRWIKGINQSEPCHPGDFLYQFATAVCRADDCNYPLVRPTLLALKAKFSKVPLHGGAMTIAWSNSAPTRPVLRYHGGKFRLAPKLVRLFPAHRVYTEVFGGGASVLMHKPRSYAEIYNDLDGEVVNVFRVLQNPRQAARLERMLRLTPFARKEFELGYKSTRSDIERARRTIIRSFMGFGSDSITRMKASRVGFNTRVSSVMKTGFRWDANRRGTTPASDWANFPMSLSFFCQRLQGVVIENRDAFTILEKMDYHDALHYVDPPYPIDTRSIINGRKPEHQYRHEMTDDDHVHLAALLHRLQGMVIISSYPGALYAELFKGWQRIGWQQSLFLTETQ